MGRPKKTDNRVWRVVCRDGMPYHSTSLVRSSAVELMDNLNRKYKECRPHRLQLAQSIGGGFIDDMEAD